MYPLDSRRVDRTPHKEKYSRILTIHVDIGIQALRYHLRHNRRVGPLQNSDDFIKNIDQLTNFPEFWVTFDDLNQVAIVGSNDPPLARLSKDFEQTFVKPRHVCNFSERTTRINPGANNANSSDDLSRCGNAAFRHTRELVDLANNFAKRLHINKSLIIEFRSKHRQL